MKPSLDQLIQSLEQITQQLKNLEIVFGSAAETYNQQKNSPWRSIVKMEMNTPDSSKDDF